MRTVEEKQEGVRLTRQAMDALKKSNLHPGFDYQQALLDLKKYYSQEQMAEFCGYSNASISKIIKGKSDPSHPKGEMIYILYIETFNRKDSSDYIPAKGLVPSYKPPNKNLDFDLLL
jgi:hypothetical protein